MKQQVGNTPALCPVSAGVPLTDEGKQGSTVCFTQYSTGKVRGRPFQVRQSAAFPVKEAGHNSIDGFRK